MVSSLWVDGRVDDVPFSKDVWGMCKWWVEDGWMRTGDLGRGRYLCMVIDIGDPHLRLA